MKRPDRTLHVFSLSALDLFASAMGTFVVLVVLLFPYYLKNHEVVAENHRLRDEIQATENALTTALAELEQAKAEAEAAQAAAAAAAAENAELRQTVEDLTNEIERLRAEAAQAAERGDCDPSRWEYVAGSRFVLYMCDSGNPDEQLLVGIVYQAPQPGTNHLRAGDMAMVARRRGNQLEGYWWTWNNIAIECVYRGIAEAFSGSIAPDEQSMTIRTANGVTEDTGDRNRCVFERTRMDTLTIRRVS